jgi:predicted ferric reductase
VVSVHTQVLSDLRIHVDGPFGAPAVAYSRYAVVLLVATGVGVTPFLSMVRGPSELATICILLLLVLIITDTGAVACSVPSLSDLSSV